VFVVDQSRKSRTANAAVTGLGRTRRILLFDTLLDTFTPDEVARITWAVHNATVPTGMGPSAACT